MEGRIEELRKVIHALEEEGQQGRKLRRAKERLEETEAEYREAGGGKGLRAYFSLVNTRKRVSRLEKAMQLAHKEIEDADEQEMAAQARKRRAYAAAEKCSRELENEKAKLAYMSLQNAQEAGQMAHGYGVRSAIIALRGVLQQARRLDGVPHLDALEGVLNHLDPSPYQGDADPIILGLQVSEEESMSGHASSEVEAQEGNHEATNKRRRGGSIGRRWSTAEDRERQRRREEVGVSSDSSDESSGSRTSEEDNGTAASIVVDGPQAEVSEATATLQRSVANLVHTVEANQQIAVQERMQRQQDVEVSALRAVALLTGEQGWVPPAPKAYAPNPRLELSACRRTASTPGRDGEPQGGMAARMGRNKEAQALAARGRAKDRAGREASRSRGRKDRR
jgi:hypothetical protein